MTARILRRWRSKHIKGVCLSGAFHKAGFTCRKSQRSTSVLFVLLFTRLAWQGIVCYTFSVYYRAAVKPSSGRKGDRDSGGRSPRNLRFRLNFIVTRSPSPDFVGSSLPEGAFGLCVPKVRLLFLTSTTFVYTKAKPHARRGEITISIFQVALSFLALDALFLQR